MKTLKINLLYQCTAKCDHCRFYCENESEVTKPDFETAYSVVKGLKENFGLDMVVILGGEPGLFRDETVQLIKKIRGLSKECGSLSDIKTRLETNAFWAEDEKTAMEFLKPFQETKTEIMLSLDAFHEPYVSVGKIANAIRACLDLGIKFNLEMPYLDVKHKNNELDIKTDLLFKQLSQQFQSKIPKYKGGIVFTGRAADRFGDQFAEGRGIPQKPCTQVPWWMDGELESLDLLILEPGGYITKGCGIAIGNVNKQHLVQMLENYNAYENPIFKILLTEGPVGLGRLATKYGYQIKNNYADKCHLCHEARQVLKPHFNDILKPDQHYKKNSPKQ